ncbi:ABC transporter permease [Geobacter pelophilus]|uniref:ABC transporter permease n=1 Tax=Geoanaerobacter pelophilus TaxID=60036 RepID=A0AAW4L5N9_9BACT|nr:ABC transporter permease [Geoanaerobacter pelophilus]MBT0666316.1 ABC transporter permease [Geoanaerobacter pelophilus]
MFERLKAMLIKEFIQVLRDKRTRFVIFVIPVFQVVVFGYAVNTDVRNSRMAILDRDNSSESREIVERFTRSGYFQTVERIADERRMTELLNRGDVRGVMVFDAGFGGRVQGKGEAPLALVLDGSDANSAGIVLSYASAIIAAYNIERLSARAAREGVAQPLAGVVLQSRAWFNPNLESRVYFIPAVIAMLVMVVTMVLSSMAVVREKEMGTIEQVVVTPITRSEFIIGKTLPFILMGYANVAIVAAVAVHWFDIPIRGSLGLLAVATGLFLMSSLGAGLLISTISSTQQQALMSAFFVIFPGMLLSGFAFPIDNMPESIRYVTILNPLRWFMVILRAIFLKGVGMEILWKEMAALGGLGLAVLLIAVARFRKTVG